MRQPQHIPPGTLLRTWERVQLNKLLNQGEAPVRVIKRAQVLSLLDKGKWPLDIAEFLGMARTTPYRIEQKYRNEGFEVALVEPSRPSHGRVIDERQAVEILAMVCETPPQGRARWTVRLVAAEAMRRGLVKKVSREPIRKLLKDGGLKPWREKNVVHSEDNTHLRGQDGRRPRGLRPPLESQGAGRVSG